MLIYFNDCLIGLEFVTGIFYFLRTFFRICLVVRSITRITMQHD